MTDAKATDADTRVLVARYKQGDKTALDALFSRYYERIERIARVRTGPTLLRRMELEDVVQDALVEALRAMDSYEPRQDARFVDWLARIVQNKVANLADRWQAQKRSSEFEAADSGRVHGGSSATGRQFAADTTGVSERASRAEMVEIVDACLAELPDEHREVIVLREYAGGDWEWIAPQVRSSSVHAAQQLYQRARQALRERVRLRVRD